VGQIEEEVKGLKTAGVPGAQGGATVDRPHSA
jgi:hypothetical protein